MVLDGKHFEQNFREPVLKKAYHLFNKGKVELAYKTSPGTFHFLTGSQELTLRKKGDSILSFSCSCSSSALCEHLAAALLYFYDRSFETERIWKNGKNKGVKNQKGDLTAYNLASQDLREITATFAMQSKLNQDAINRLVQRLVELRSHAKTNGKLFFADLVLVSEFDRILHFRFTGDEKTLWKLYQDCQKNLERIYYKGITTHQMETWLLGLKSSLRSNTSLLSDAYSFLLPRYLAKTKDLAILEELQDLLKRRKRKLHHSESVNPLESARLQVEIRLAEIKHVKMFVRPEGQGAELSIAAAGLLFSKKQNARALALLEKDQLRIKTKYLHQYLRFLDYVIVKSRLLNDVKVELKFLKRRLTAGAFIEEGQVDRFRSLLPEKHRQKEYDELINDIRKNSGPFAFEKLSLLLRKEQRYPELLMEIKAQKNQFQLVHLTALKMYPTFPQELFTLYVQHFAEALAEARYYQVQQSLFETAADFFRKLPAAKRELLMEKILDKIGHQAQISKYIRQETGALQEPITRT